MASDVQKTIANDGIDHPLSSMKKQEDQKQKILNQELRCLLKQINPAVVIYTGNYLQDIGF